MILRQVLELREFCQKTQDGSHTCAGDFNSYVGMDAIQNNVRLGQHAFEQETKVAGKQIVKWIKATDLSCLSSLKAIRERGTWAHTHAKAWHEIDKFMVCSEVMKCDSHITAVVKSVSVHEAKALDITFKQLNARKKRKDRREKFRRIDQIHNGQKKKPLRMDFLSDQ